nr:hypothetical protein [Tanacetum cinerariifolium]
MSLSDFGLGLDTSNCYSDNDIEGGCRVYVADTGDMNGIEFAVPETILWAIGVMVVVGILMEEGGGYIWSILVKFFPTTL